MNTRTVIICAIALTAINTVSTRGEGNPLYQQARAEKNIDKAIDLYWRYFQEAPDDAAFGEATDDFSRHLVINDRFTDLVRLGDMLLGRERPAASIMNRIAWALAVKDTALEKALSYSQAAVAGQHRDLDLPPPRERSATAWRERQRHLLGYYLDTEGYIQLKRGEADVALITFLQADSLVDEPEIHLHLAQAYHQTGDVERAMHFAILARYGLGSDEDGDLDQLLSDAYQKMTGSKEGLDDYINGKLDTLRKEERRRLVQERLDMPAKEFELASLGRNKVKLSDYRGRIVLMDFWATWCGPCLKELPHLQAAYQQWKEESVELLAISTDKDTSKVAPFMAENGYTFPVLFDAGASKDYDVSGIPTLFVVDQKGRIQYRHFGYRPDIVEILNLQIQALRH